MTPATTATVSAQSRTYFTAPAAQWLQAIGFLLSLALFSLEFWPALLLVGVFLIHSFRSDRYFFLIELFLLCGGYGYIRPGQFPVNSYDIGLLIGIIGIIIYRRNKMVKRLTLAMLAYFAVILLIASTSDENMAIQFRRIRLYLGLVSFFIPMVIFANRQFEWQKFIHTVMLFTLTICLFYTIDTFILNGGILVPSATWVRDSFGKAHYSSISHLVWDPLSLWWPRHYPYGLYWMALCIIPLATKQVRLRPLHYALVFLAIFASRTMTFMAGILIGFASFAGQAKKMIKYSLGTIVVLSALYAVDSSLGSPMRVASTVDQFTSLSTAADQVDLSEFGSGRMAQIIPKWELLFRLNRQWLGFGFLHPELTTNPKYAITNEYYTDTSRSEEVATAVEVTQVQTIFDIGFVGLLVQTAFYVGLYFMIRRLRHASYYLCVLITISVFGLGGFAGLSLNDGLFLLGLTLGAILLSNPECRLASFPSDSSTTTTTPQP